MSAVPAAVRRSQAFHVVRAHWVQAISVRSPALPQARIAPTPFVPQSSTLYIWVRQPVAEAGIFVAPSLLPESQERPPSKDRSIQTSSPGLPLLMDAHAIASLSLKCSRICRE